MSNKLSSKGKVSNRLKPTSETVRKLYLLSGNRCAFPGCLEAIVSNTGVLQGEIAHIEAAENGGPRFNPSQDDEQRRSFNNLMLLCLKHHNLIDGDPKSYPVSVLRIMKNDHESKYQDVIGVLQSTVVDYSKATIVKKATNCKRLFKVLNWEEDQRVIDSTIKELNELCDCLVKLPIPTRKLFCIMVSRAYQNHYNSWRVLLSEVSNATGISGDGLRGHINTLARYKLTSDEDYDELTRLSECILYGYNDWNDCWIDIREYCEKTKVSLSTICTDCDFSVFDE